MGFKSKEKSFNKFSAGISIEKFANAKSVQYNKREKLDRAAALRARRIRKYRKIKAKLGGTQTLTSGIEASEQNDDEYKRAVSRAGPAPSDTPESGSAGSATSSSDAEREESSQKLACRKASAAEKTSKTYRGIKEPDSRLAQKGRQKWQKPLSQIQKLAKQAQREKDERTVIRQRRIQDAEERQKRITEIESKRKRIKKGYFKTTQSGQPVLKNRIAKILDQLEAETA